MNSGLRSVAVLAAGLVLGGGGSVYAQGSGGSGTGDWHYGGGIYFWVPVSIDGTSTVNGVDAPVDLGFDEITELFQGGLAARFEAWNRDTWGIILDGWYADLGTEVQTAGPRADVDITENIFDILGAYRLTPDSDGLSGGMFPGGSETAVDFMFGARYHYLKQEIDIVPGPLLGGSADWFDLVIGARVQWGINERWSTALRGDLAGFGIGDGSDLTYNFWATANYHPWDRWALLFGYRVYGLDYETGTGLQRFGMDVTEHGPFVAISFWY
ncbi:MAG: hypothetical protein JSU82_05545 [Rhodospirillales bacterium]|nr:MAG: hypothetical protein JSU82_05545 [Rhodospirillales bacterium]